MLVATTVNFPASGFTRLGRLRDAGLLLCFVAFPRKGGERTWVKVS
jgi:hypothetical protein